MPWRNHTAVQILRKRVSKNNYSLTNSDQDGANGLARAWITHLSSDRDTVGLFKCVCSEMPPKSTIRLRTCAVFLLSTVNRRIAPLSRFVGLSVVERHRRIPSGSFLFLRRRTSLKIINAPSSV